jgi:cytochrome c-type biogenesis protein CcmH
MKTMKHLLPALLLIPCLVAAEEAKPLAENPQAEARLKALALELRCLVCQNQTLADSNAPLAEDLRLEAREMIAKNMSDQEISDFLVQQYGDFVLHRPLWKASTILLWTGPSLLLIGGAITLVEAIRRRGQVLAGAPVTDEERWRVEPLLLQGERRS